MAGHRSCSTRKKLGGLTWHAVAFQGPDRKRACELPESQQGHVAHTFENLSIYPITFTTAASASTAALQVVGAASPPAVTVPAPKSGALLTRPETGIASQLLEHQAGTGVGLPLTATVGFATTITSPGVALPAPPNVPAISVMLKP